MGNFDLRGIFKKAAAGATALTLAATVMAPVMASAGAPRVQQTIESHTYKSHDIVNLAKRFNDERSDVRIVPMDPDWFQLNVALNDGTMLDARMMGALVETYLADKSDIPMGADYYKYIHWLLGLGLNNTLPIHRFRDNGAGELKHERSVCLLFPYNGDKNGEDHVKSYLLGLTPEINGDIYKAQLNKLVRPELQQKYSDYHEIGHCFDRWYIEESLRLKAQAQGVPTVRSMIQSHKEEMFPEIMAGLLLAREGVDDIMLERADIRLAGNAVLGPAAYRMKSDMPLPGGQNAGFVYALSGGLEAAQRKVDEMGEGIRSLTLNEIAELAHTLTEENAMGESEALGALFLWRYFYDVSMLNKKADLRLETRHNPELDFNKAYNFVIKFRDEMNDALPRVLDLRGRMETGRDALAVIDFQFPKGPRAPSTLFKAEDVRPVFMVKDELMARMKESPGRGLDALVTGFERYKNDLREIVHESSGASDKERRQARYTLSVLTEALRLAVREVRFGPAPSQEELERRLREQQKGLKNNHLSPRVAPPVAARP